MTEIVKNTTKTDHKVNLLVAVVIGFLAGFSTCFIGSNNAKINKIYNMVYHNGNRTAQLADSLEIKYDKNYRGGKRSITIAKKFVRRVKAMSRCIKCGESRPWCLDYHHRDTKEKFMAIPDMAKRGFPTDVLKIELNKCDCLCSNCHREIHFRRFWLKI